jgi:sialidase-1
VSAFSPVFVAGVGGYACYRIPSLLVLANGTLLAFAEGRRFSCADHGWNDIVQRASHDGGATWSALSVVYGESTALKNVTIGNPAPVVLSANTLLMPFSRENLEVGRGRSEDGGSTWALAARSIAVPPGTWTTWVATGPPGSVRLRGDGRIAIAMNFANSTVKAAAAVLLSDDAGATWRLSAGVVRGGNENQVAELPWRSTPAAAVLHMTMRNAAGASRLASESVDGGEHWTAPWETVGPEDACEGSVVALPRTRRLAMSNAFAAKRENMTLHVSGDDGHSWAPAALVWAGPSAYSSVAAGAAAGSDVVHLLFEKGDKSPYESIAFASVTLM